MYIELSFQALQDIEEILEYYSRINQKLPTKFLERIEEAKSRIVNSELGFEIKYKTVRTVLLKQFPYHLHYVLKDDNIIIIAVLHSRINPKTYLY
ncbi:type II toxin-antitoxin system RelE/ParE family toxin [Epilithonimonas sp.]|uniref:type II toxin-antitoxin system RelE/ParE family toxin n=1 Tax=Epilithonimonas sp. TaxID=2894511 RepID=UPI002896CAF7|nr:type II toxin-antitoxin system RelE/ParE family toxin [Epilithonimonas sp.]